MVSVYEIDPKTLNWIKEEVNQTVDEARHELEVYLDNPRETGQLKSCADLLHRINGAVAMAEIFGATLLATEMENVTRALYKDSLKHKNDAVEVLMLGILQLPAYLDQLSHGHKDIPLVLLPLLNDLLAVQDKELLTESTFFFPNLAVYKPPAADHPPSIDDNTLPKALDAEEIAKKFRPGYLSGLLGLFRGDDVVKGLQRLAIVVKNLEHASAQKKVVQLWWVTSGVIHALYDKGLETSVAVKLLLGRVDRQMKRLIDEGESALSAEPPDELIKNLLYYIGRSTSTSTRVVELKKAFVLNDTLLDENLINQAKNELIGFNAHIMDDISKQIEEELLKIKDKLDVVVYSEEENSDILDSVIGGFTMVADALGMLGMTRLRKIAITQQLFIKELVTTGANLGNDDILHVAGALLYIESSICDLNVNSNFDDNESVSGDITITNSMPEAEYRQLVKLVVQDVINELDKVKNAVIEMLIEDTTNEVLSSVPDSIKLIAGTLELMSFSYVASIVRAIGYYIEQELSTASNSPDEADLDQLANAVMGVECYLESILEISIAPEEALDMAQAGITQLGYNPQKFTAKRMASGLVGKTADATDGSSVSLIDAEDQAKGMGINADEELMKVFVMEADDELETININFKKWKGDQKDHKSLNCMVRSFHTLKGAGRIIGVTTIGLLAWSVEELLRCLQDGSVQPCKEIFELLDQMVPAMMQLIAQVKQGDISEQMEDVQPLVDMARELRKSGAAVG